MRRTLHHGDRQQCGKSGRFNLPSDISFFHKPRAVPMLLVTWGQLQEYQVQNEPTTDIASILWMVVIGAALLTLSAAGITGRPGPGRRAQRPRHACQCGGRYSAPKSPIWFADVLDGIPWHGDGVVRRRRAGRRLVILFPGHAHRCPVATIRGAAGAGSIVWCDGGMDVHQGQAAHEKTADGRRWHRRTRVYPVGSGVFARNGHHTVVLASVHFEWAHGLPPMERNFQSCA